MALRRAASHMSVLQRGPVLVAGGATATPVWASTSHRNRRSRICVFSAIHSADQPGMAWVMCALSMARGGTYAPAPIRRTARVPNCGVIWIIEPYLRRVSLRGDRCGAKRAHPQSDARGAAHT